MSARPRHRFHDPRPTSCYRGHEYTPENTRVIMNYWGREVRRCRECIRLWSKAAKARLKHSRRHCASEITTNA